MFDFLSETIVPQGYWRVTLDNMISNKTHKIAKTVQIGIKKVQTISLLT
jgi:hypothetical protein